MAEAFLFDIVGTIVLQLGSDALQHIGLAWGVKEELRKLENTMSTLKNVLQDAEEKQVSNRAVKEWLQRLKVVVRDADDLVDEFATEALRRQVETQGSNTKEVYYFFTKFNPVKFHYGVGRKIKDIMEGLDEIVSEMGKFGFIVGAADRPVQIREREKTHSFVRGSNVIGRKGDKKAIIQLLASSEENVQIIPIVGMGGLGKTTLAQLVYNDNWVASQFAKRLWVCVSDDFDVEKIMSNILRAATNSESNSLRMEELQIQVRQVLNAGKFFLVLDDVWNDDPVKWRKLQDFLIDGASGSRIVVTTRSKKVASLVGNMGPYELKGLSDRKCLSIFVKWAFKEGEESRHLNLVNIGRDMVKKCGGVPLAAKSLGAMLFLNTDEQDWLSLKDNEMWTLVQNENDILPVLKLSYDQMPSDLKQCFAYCSLFEKNSKLRKGELIYHWMAQGFIQSSSLQNKELEDIGEYYVDELVRKSFLQNGNREGEYKMHDLVHDLARYVAGNECFTISRNTKKIPEGVSYLSFDFSLLFHEFPRPWLKGNKWRTIFLTKKGDPSFNSSFENLVSSSKCLRVLDTGYWDPYGIVVPKSISKLKHLRFLRCRCVKELPESFGKLLNLQFLDLRGLSQLPEDFGKLINLRVLFLSVSLERLPEKAIGGLSSLRKLQLFRCPDLVSLPSSMRCLPALEELEIMSCLSLTFSDGDFQGLRKLKSLKLHNVPKMVSLPKGLQDVAASLNHLFISHCTNLTTIAKSLPSLTSLHTLQIKECPKVSSLPKGMQYLTTLHSLKISECINLSQRCKEGSGEDWPKIAHVPEIQIDGKKIKSPNIGSGELKHPL